MKYILKILSMAVAILLLASCDVSRVLIAFAGPALPPPEHILPQTEEFKALCEKEAKLKVYKTVKDVRGYYDPGIFFGPPLDPLMCGHQCAYALFESGYDFVEGNLSRGRILDYSIRYDRRLEDFPGEGVYRFTRTYWGDPRAQQYMDDLRHLWPKRAAYRDWYAKTGSKEPTVIDGTKMEFGPDTDKAVFFEKIEKPTTRYQTRDRGVFKTEISEDGNYEYSYMSDTVIDTHNDDEILGENIFLRSKWLPEELPYPPGIDVFKRRYDTGRKSSCRLRYSYNIWVSQVKEILMTPVKGEQDG